MINKVEICGVNTSKLPTLTAQEKRELFERIKMGDAIARETFIRGNLRLVLSVIGRFNNRGENVDDLFQVGCIGLIKAIDNFDLCHEVKWRRPSNRFRRPAAEKNRSTGTMWHGPAGCLRT